ncbi:MAG TPA: hypothetical protein ENI87_09235 [bacterium]|nr:hypothetical protein [bacterium]
MPEPTRKRRRPLVLLLAVAASTAIALGAAELLLRAMAPEPRVLGAIGYADENGTPVENLTEAAARGLVVPLTGELPRRRFMFAPGKRFYITYSDNDVLKRDWLDEQGRVVNEINSAGIRDREELVAKKPAGQRRIVCLGDSFTFGWGIPVELGWVRLLEDELRRNGTDVRTVNCGAAGTVCVDEYVLGLKQRFYRFEPDAVVLTICLNDLIPSSGLGFLVPRRSTGSRVLDLLLGPFQRGPLDLDPERDWVGELLALPKDEAEAGGLAHPIDKPFEAMWSQGVPQKSLREGKAWCDARGIPFMVILWPFLQGLGEGRHYPFQKIHDLAAADCAEAGIPFLDVLPALRSTAQEDLWVTPADPHPNPLAQRLVLPSIVAFVRAQTGW